MSNLDLATIESLYQAALSRFISLPASIPTDYVNALLPVIATATTVARAEGWDEGYTSGHSNAMRQMSDEPNAPTSPNPHRVEGGR